MIRFMQKLGVNIDELLVSQPDTGEQALEIAEALVRSGAIDVLVVDSVAALVPRAEIEEKWVTCTWDCRRVLMSQAMRKLSGAISKSQTTALLLTKSGKK